MRNLRRAATILTGVVALGGGAAILAVGCGGDDTIVGVGSDGGGGDAADGSSIDTGVVDSGSDAFVFDAGPPQLEVFYQQINRVGCAWLQNCCTNGSEGNDGGFDLNSCLSTFVPENGGFLYTSPVQDPIDGGGNVTFHEDIAAQCLSLIQGLSCTDAFTSTKMKQIRDACNGAVVGNIAAGSTGCQATIECAPPAHCEIPDGGSTGTCVAPYAQGAPCISPGDDTLTSIGRCGRPYTGEPRYCEVGQSVTVPEGGTCNAPDVNGTACDSPFECQSWLCDLTNTATCVDSAQIILPGNDGTCGIFAPVDGG